MSRKPTLTRKLLTLNLDREAAQRIESMAEERGQKAGEFVEALISRMLTAEGADEVYWFLVALNGEDNARLGTYARKHGWDVEVLLDEIVGDGIDDL